MVGLKQGSALKGGKYKIVKTLGQGSFGITYLATTRISMDGQLGKMDVNVNVTIKEFFMSDLNSRATDGTSVERTNSTLVKNYLNKFQREAANLSKLHHPNIVKVLEVFDENNTTYYVMEFIDGETIDEYIKRNGKLSVEESLKFTKEVCAALSYMHDHKMLHLDLKPKNIMRDSEGHIYLIDFGLAKQYNENGEPESSTTLGLGTPGYAPIEQAHYKQDGTFPVTLDIYAVGASLYKMLTGKTPPESSYVLNDGLPLDALKQVGVDDNVIAIVEKAMAPIKKDRYQTVAALLEDISTLSPSDDERTDIKDVDEGTIIDQEVVNKKKVTIYPDTNKIDFYFNGSSVPPPYHRSYETHITEHSISLKITCYDDVLYDGKFPFNKSRYDNLLNVIRNLNIKSIPEESSGATGGETLTLALHKGDEEYFSCYIYGSEYQIFEGTTDANLYIIKKEIEKCIPNFEALISKQKDEESEVQDEKNEEDATSFVQKYWKHGVAAITLLLCIFFAFFFRSKSGSDDVITYYNDLSSIQIGDYLYADGTYTHKLDSANLTNCSGCVYNLTTTESEKEEGWTHGHIVALKDAVDRNGNTKFEWGPENSEIPNCQNHSEAIKAKDGYWYCLMDSACQSPAISSIEDFDGNIFDVPLPDKCQWYVPTLSDWKDILVNLGKATVTEESESLLCYDGKTVSSTLHKKIGGFKKNKGQPNDDDDYSYWTCIQQGKEWTPDGILPRAWAIYANGEFGNIGNSPTRNKMGVRPVSAF